MDIFPQYSDLTAEQYAALAEELARWRATQPPATPPRPEPVAPVQPQVVAAFAQLAAQQLKPPKPDCFRGGRKVASWLFGLEQYFLVMGAVSDESKVLFAGTLLLDTAADWWRGVSKAITNGLQAPISSWPEFKARLTAHFQPVNEEDFARQQVRILKQTGGVRDFVARYQALILQIPSMDERSKVDNFTTGLKAGVRQWVKLQDPHTLEAAMRVAEQFQTTLLHDRRMMGHRSGGPASVQDAGVGGLPLGDQEQADEAAPMELGYAAYWAAQYSDSED